MKNTWVELGTWIIIMTILTLSVIGLASAELNDTESYFTFDDADTTASTSIDSAENNNGTIASSVTTGVTAILNQGYSFNADEGNVTIDNEANFDFTTTVTVALWVNPGETSTWQAVQSKGTVASGSGGFYILYDNDAEDAVTCFYSTGSAVFRAYTDIGQDNWVHLVCDYNGSRTGDDRVRVYVNGTNVSATHSGTHAASIGVNNNPVRIGARQAGGNSYNGTMDEVGIWDRSLTLSEVQELYNNGNGFNPYDVATNLSITAVNNRTSATINTFNASVTNSTINYTFTTTTGTINTNISSNSTSLFNITVRSTNFFNNETTNYNVSTDYQASLIPYTIINATTSTGTNILNFTINYTISGNTTVIDTITTTTGTVNLPLFNNTYTVTIFNANQAGTNYASDDVNLTANNYVETHTFTLFTTNSVEITIRDEETRNIIDFENLTIDFISDIEASERNTSNGTLFIDLLSPAEIEIVYDGPSYRERSYYFNLVNQSYTNLTLYLLNESVGSLIIVENTDTTGDEVEGVVLQLLRGYIIDGAQSFEIVEMDKTDFAGEAVISAELNEPVYQIKVVRNVTDNEILFFGTTAFEITSTLLQIQLNTLEDPLQSFNNWRDISYTDITYDSTTAIYSATYTDNAGLINPGGTVCLVVERIIGVEYVYFNQSCSSAITATLNVFYNDTSHSSVASLRADTNTENSDYILDVFETYVGARQAVADALGESGAFISAIIIYGVGAMLIFNPTTYIIGIIAGTIGVFIMGFVNVSWSATMIALILMGGILAFKMRGV